MAATLVRTIPLGPGGPSTDGKAYLYMLPIDGVTHTFNTYHNLGPAIVNSTDFQAILSLIVSPASSTDITFGLSAAVDFPLKGISGPHGMPMTKSAYIVGTDGYRIQVKASAACTLLYTICETSLVRI